MPEIRKIVVGPDFKEGMSFALEQKTAKDRDENSKNHGKFTEKITRIIETENRFEIWVVALNGSNEHKLWRAFQGVPISIEYSIDY